MKEDGIKTHHRLRSRLMLSCKFFNDVNIILGGEEILIEYAGKDSTEAFDDVGHSQDAKDILKQFHIGTIVESERASNRAAKKKEETKK